MTAFLSATGHASYADAYAWSVLHPEEFWPAMWKFADTVGEQGSDVVAQVARLLVDDLHEQDHDGAHRLLGRVADVALLVVLGRVASEVRGVPPSTTEAGDQTPKGRRGGPRREPH